MLPYRRLRSPDIWVRTCEACEPIFQFCAHISVLLAEAPMDAYPASGIGAGAGGHLQRPADPETPRRLSVGRCGDRTGHCGEHDVDVAHHGDSRSASSSEMETPPLTRPALP